MIRLSEPGTQIENEPDEPCRNEECGGDCRPPFGCRKDIFDIVQPADSGIARPSVGRSWFIARQQGQYQDEHHQGNQAECPEARPPSESHSQDRANWNPYHESGKVARVYDAHGYAASLVGKVVADISNRTG